MSLFGRVSAGYDDVLALVCRHVSAIHARSALDRAISTLGVDAQRMTKEELAGVAIRVEQNVSLFLTPTQRDALRAELEALTNTRVQLDPETIALLAEDDILTARGRARAIALRMGSTGLTAQRAATIVSELARNIVSYAKTGRIELRPDIATRRLHIVATDQGPGIAQLDAILAGEYRSRTGLGLGLRGCRNLADAMHIESSAQGTRISVEVAV